MLICVIRGFTLPREKPSYSLLPVHYQNGDTFDGIVWLGAYRADMAAHAVRMVRFRVGSDLYTYLTSVLDPEWLPMLEIARLYVVGGASSRR